MTGQPVRDHIFVDARLPAPGHAWIETAAPGVAARLRRMADREGWLPHGPQWWGEDEMARLLPDPAVRQIFTADCPRLPLAMLDAFMNPSAPPGAADGSPTSPPLPAPLPPSST